ncbi:hypothetical protein BAE44_0016656 [Dichanthelium oligosanthes]|uniref:DUF1618 domain-containing protein n=1 Tax=Dichanthelium oligosanthes TaxID=888268 RepID=A0A1E5VBD8_9POAL|nr:hypothetical protein BAE44_0016656 [Dichanthelium oligosanthes]
METLTKPREPSVTPAAAEPGWVMLNTYGCFGDDFVVTDAKTVADSITSKGRHFRVSMALAAPPACSLLYHDLVGSAPSDEEETHYSHVIAAHGDSVLFHMTHGLKDSFDDEDSFDYDAVASDHFVYTAGGASLPPLLLLLPGRYIPMLFEGDVDEADDRDAAGRTLKLEDTGILRRGEDELLVVQLEVAYKAQRDTAELCVLRLGNNWDLKRAVPIVHEDGGQGDGLPHWWESVAAIPVGDRYLCWVNYLDGFLLCDMADMASPSKLRYVRLPVNNVYKDEEGRRGYASNHDKPTLRCSRNMCAAGAGAVRFVSVDSRCCCGGPGWSSCPRSRFAFTVTTWTLTLRMDEPMTWVKDGVLDCDELWALPEYGSVPRVPLEYPVVSSDDPDVVCFMVRNDYSSYRKERKVWMLEVDTRSKRLRSVLPCNIDPYKAARPNIPAKLHF